MHGLIEHDLVDEYRLMVFPIILGSGKRLFPETKKAARLRLTSSATESSGVQLLTLEPDRARN